MEILLILSLLRLMVQEVMIRFMVLSTSERFELNVVGGSGDDEFPSDVLHWYLTHQDSFTPPAITGKVLEDDNARLSI